MKNRTLVTRFRLFCFTALMAMTGPAMALDVYLVARQGTLTMPDGVTTIPFWGFAQDADNNLATDGGEAPLLPGPAIRLPAGDSTLNIHLRNDLTQEPVSIVIPGQVNTTPPMAPAFHASGPYAGRLRAFTDNEAAPGGGIANYTWNNLKPGTYLYQSGTHIAVQVQMGLYGALTRDVAAGEAYPGMTYGEDHVLLYSELDPTLHNAVATGNYGPVAAMTSTIDYKPRYFLVNGVPFSAPTSVPVPVNGVDGKRILLRFLNAGLETHVPVLQGLYMRLIAEDGNPYRDAHEQYSVRLLAGQTIDALLGGPMCAGGVPSGNHALYDRRLRLTNAAQTEGGMLTYLQLADNDGDGIANICDNCIATANPSQLDTNGDGYGNRCDTDLDGNGTTSLADFGIFRSAFGAHGTNDADFNGDGVVSLTDFGIFRAFFGQALEPSGVTPP